jgi:hypothetical protein
VKKPWHKKSQKFEKKDLPETENVRFKNLKN